MDDPAQHEASERNVDHDLRNVEALFGVSDEAFPPSDPAEGSLNDPLPGQYPRAGLLICAHVHRPTTTFPFDRRDEQRRQRPFTVLHITGIAQSFAAMVLPGNTSPCH